MLFLKAFTSLLSLVAVPANDDKARDVADRALQRYPLIDLHVDIPIQLRFRYRGDVSHTNYSGPLGGQVDLGRLQKGKSGGLFSIAYVQCPESPKGGSGQDRANALFLSANNAVRDTLEQIDVTHQLVAQYAEQVGLATRASDVGSLHRQRKIAHLIGIEGAHSLGNSLAVLRTYYNLGVRYLTLTHVCHNAFADTAGSTEGRSAQPLHDGLSKLGERLIDEMNRIGMIVDVSHTSDQTARQAILRSRAPVIFSHSGARAVHEHPRNVPDDVLRLIAEDSGRDGVV